MTYLLTYSHSYTLVLLLVFQFHMFFRIFSGSVSKYNASWFKMQDGGWGLLVLHQLLDQAIQFVVLKVYF